LEESFLEHITNFKKIDKNGHAGDPVSRLMQPALGECTHQIEQLVALVPMLSLRIILFEKRTLERLPRTVSPPRNDFHAS